MSSNVFYVIKLIKKTMVGNPPSEAHVAKKQTATLIVVPSGLVSLTPDYSNFSDSYQKSQWLGEIKQHISELGENTAIYKGSAEDNTLTRLKNSDVVLTTYCELAHSILQPDPKTVQRWKKDNKIDLFAARLIFFRETCLSSRETRLFNISSTTAKFESWLLD